MQQTHGQKFKAQSYDGVVYPNCKHTVHNSAHFVRAAAINNKSIKKRVCNLERSTSFSGKKDILENLWGAQLGCSV